MANARMRFIDTGPPVVVIGQDDITASAAAFRFDKNQLRDYDGRWVKVPGSGLSKKLTDDFKKLTNQDVADLHHEMHGKKKWTTSQAKALNHYASDGHKPMNQALRGKIKPDAKTTKSINDAKAGLRPTSRDIRVYRGTGPSQFGVKSTDELKQHIGEVFHDPAFASTSVNRMNKVISGSPLRLEIEVPKGTPGAYIADISNNPGEQEFLLGPDLHYELIEVKETVIGDVARLRVVPKPKPTEEPAHEVALDPATDAELPKPIEEVSTPEPQAPAVTAPSAAPSGKPVVPAIIYKKPADGTIVGQSADGGQRMRWDAGRKKFIVENEKNGSWVEESAHTKTSAYNEMKNPDKWFEPAETSTENEPSSPSLTPEPTPADTDTTAETPDLPPGWKALPDGTYYKGYPGNIYGGSEVKQRKDGTWRHDYFDGKNSKSTTHDTLDEALAHDPQATEKKVPEAPKPEPMPEPEKVAPSATSSDPNAYPPPEPVPMVDPDWPFSYEPFQEPQMDYGHLVRSSDDAYKNDPNHDYELKTLPVSTIVPSQENDYEEWGDGLDNDMTGKPFAIKKDGNLYLMDGHHRTAKAGENGSIQAWVLDLDKPKDTAKTNTPEIPQQADAPEVESITPEYTGPTVTDYAGAPKEVIDTLRQAYLVDFLHTQRVEDRAAELRAADPEKYKGFGAWDQSMQDARAELGWGPPVSQLDNALAALEKALPDYTVRDNIRRRITLEATNERMLSVFAETNNLGEVTPELKADLAKRTKDAFAGKKVAVRVTPKVVEYILNDGRLKSQFESGKSKGKNDNDMRASIEHLLFGIDDKPWQNAEKRPIYGYVAVDGIRPAGIGSAQLGDPSTDQLTQYGQVQIVLKDSVRERTTAMFGDSLNNMNEGVPSPIDDPDWKSFMASRGGVTGKGLEGLDRSGDSAEFRAGSYAEAQIHGGVSADDIEEIVFPSNPTATVKKQLEDAGIPYRVMNFKTVADGSDEERATALRIAQQDKPFIESAIAAIDEKIAKYPNELTYKKDREKYVKQLKTINDALPALQGDKKSAKSKIAAAKEKVAKATAPKQAEAPKIESTPAEGVKMFSIPPSVTKAAQDEYIDFIKQQDFFGNLPEDKKQQKNNLAKQITDMIDDKDEATRTIDALEQLGRVEQTYDEFRTRHNITTPIEEHKAELAAKVKDAFADKDIAIRVTPENLSSILFSGRFMSQFETGLATGTQDMLGKAHHEASWFGTSPRAKDDKEKRAIYGYVALNGIVPADSDGSSWKDGPDKLSMFGKVQVVLKKDVRSRTAAMYGDSAVNWHEGRLSSIDNPTWESFTGIGDPKNFSREKALRDLDRDPASFKFRSTAYAEAAITGGVTADDIAEVVFDKNPAPAIQEQLAEKDIPWRVLTVATAAKVAKPHERDGIQRMLEANVQHYENAIKAAESERDEHAAKGWGTKEDEADIKKFNAQLTKAKSSLAKFMKVTV